MVEPVEEKQTGNVEMDDEKDKEKKDDSIDMRRHEHRSSN